MELRCALVLLAHIGFVISSPYGYGPRAGAKADASAVAGAYSGAGALPIDIPQGAGGYSGSFSKSFSSSSASASSSSSASSSAFSYSGSSVPYGGAGCGSDACKLGVKGVGSQGYSGFGSDSASISGQGKPGAEGQYNNDASGSNNEPKTDCGLGNCPGSKGSGASNAYSGANAVASAGTGIQTESSYSKEKNEPTQPACAGSDCNSRASSDGNCGSGQCGSSGNSVADLNGKVKCSSGNCDTTPQSQDINGKCASGQCGPYTQAGSPSNEYGSNDIHVPTSSTGQSNAKTNGYGSHGQGSVTHSDSNCKYGNNCGTQPTSNPSYIPEYPPCSSPDCNNYGQSPSSTPGNQGNINKPSIILTVPKENAECSTPDCQSTSSQTKPFKPNGYATTNTGPSQNTLTYPHNLPCTGRNCQSSYTKPPYSTNPVSPYPSSQIPSGPSKCSLGHCNTNPSTHGSTGYGGSPPLSPLTPFEPICAPGSPNCNAGSQISGCPIGSPSCNNNLASKPTPEHHVPLTPSGPLCAPGSPYCNAGAQPSECPPGFPNCNKNLSPKPTPGQLTPPPPASICAGPPGSLCNDAFVANQKPMSPFPLAQKCPPGLPFCNSGTGPSSIPPNYQVRPNGVRPYSPLPPGSITFPSSPSGGSYSHTGASPSTGYQPEHTSSDSYTPSSLSSYSIPTAGGCNLPYCGGAGIVPVAATAGANAQSKPIGESKESDKLPPYHGGFGGPPGILKPNEYEAPSPSSPLTSSKLPGASSPICASGNCGPHSSSSYGSHPGLPATAEIGANPGPSGTPEAKQTCSSGNCGSSLNASPTYGSSAGSQATAAGGAGTGFGGPSGILKPNEFTVPTSTYNKPASIGAPTKPVCSTENCGTASSPSYSHGISGGQATASASASADAVVYTGGFGGPPGILKPYDGGKVDLSVGKATGQYGLHQGPYSNNGAGSHQGSYSNNGVGSDQGSYLNNGAGSYSNNGAGSHQGSLTNNGLGSYQGSYSNNGVGTNAIQSSSVAQANAVAGANTGSYGQVGSGGCGGGCSGGSYGGYRGSNYGSSSGLGLSKSGLDGLNGAVSGATAKSLSGGVGSGGYGGSFASSSASAHASSGAAVKGSYG